MCPGVSSVPRGQQRAGEPAVCPVGRAASTTAPAQAQLSTDNGIAHDPTKLLSPCLPRRHFPSQPHTQVLGPFLASLLRLLVPRLGFLGICRGETPSGQCPAPLGTDGCPQGAAARENHSLLAPTLLGPGAGSRRRRGAAAPGGHVLRGPGCGTQGALGIRRGPFSGGRGWGLAPEGQRLRGARGGGMDGDRLATGVGQRLFFGGLGGAGRGAVTRRGDTLC